MRSAWLALGVVGIAVASAAISGDVPLTPRIVHEPGFTVVGISTRTNNAKEMSDEGVIGKQWERWMKDALLDRIPSKADTNTLAVYTDYESDRNGEYTFLIGARVSSAAKIPAGMVTVKIPAGRFAVFTSEKGFVGKVVPEIWTRIWAIPKSEPGGDRSYRADYELYDQRAADPQNAQVDIYVGIK
ncbi:MAG: GyrI-like domain-containing protein [Candidatus Acidiferrales bacterium]